MSEEWRLIPSLPEYEASSLGRLRRVPHYKPMPNGGHRKYGGTPTLGTWIEDERRYVMAYKKRNYKVARLVCEAFNGSPPSPEAVCMHDDENSRNNISGNLKWGTQRDNLNYPGFLAYCRSRTGINSPRVKGRM